MRELPTGPVTFLFTDIEGSTELFERHPDTMPSALARHHALLQGAIETHGGTVFQVVGDGVCAAFVTPQAALVAALDAQRALHREDWGPIGAIRVRMGLHTGEAQAHGGEYVSSLTLVRTQRVSAAGHGGQTLLSAAMAQAVRGHLPDGTTLRDLGAFKLRGLADAESICELVVADLPSEFPALKVEDTETLPPGALDELVRGKLIGRGGELAQLRRHWEQAQQARGHLVLLSGEPGVGKTRLARELIAQAYASGATVLRGGCYEFEATTPYLPFVEAIREWARRQTPAQLRTALGATAPEIAKFAPEIEAKLGPIAPNAPLPPGDERMRLFDNVARFLQSLAASRGLLVFTDDIHWADQGTLSLLRYLLRTMQGDRVLFLAPYREIELDRAHPLAAALVEWNRERLATRIPLGRLSRADTNALLAALFGQDVVADDFADALFRETEGNPFFVEEVVKSLIEQGQIYREDGGWGRKDVRELTIPQSVKEAIGRRLDRMSEVATDTLRTAAALGKIFGFGELGRRIGNGRRRAPRCARRGERGAARPAGRGRRRLRVHPRQDSRGPLRGDESDKAAAPAPADRRGAGADAGGAVGLRRGGPCGARGAHAGSRASLHAGRRLRALAQVPAPCGRRRASRLRARRGAQVPRAGARVGRGAAARRRPRGDRRAGGRRARGARCEPARRRVFRARARRGRTRRRRARRSRSRSETATCRGASRADSRCCRRRSPSSIPQRRRMRSRTRSP